MSSPRMSWSTLYWKVLFQVGVSYICWLRLTWWLQLCGALWPVLGDESWCFPACGLLFKPERRNWDRWEWQLVSSICSNFLMAIEIDVDVCGKRSLYVVGKTKTRHLKLLKSSKLIKLVWISNKKLKYLYFILCSRKYLNLKHDIESNPSAKIFIKACDFDIYYQKNWNYVTQQFALHLIYLSNQI